MRLTTILAACALLLCTAIPAQAPAAVIPDHGIVYVVQTDGTVAAYGVEDGAPVLLGNINPGGQVIRTRWEDQEGNTHEVETKVTGTNVDLYVQRHDKLVRALQRYYPKKNG